MDDPRFVFWHSFEPRVASLGPAGVITEIRLAVFGAGFAALQPDDRRRAVQNLLAEHRLLLIWDYVARHIIPVLCPAVLCGQRRVVSLVAADGRLGGAAAGHIIITVRRAS